MKKFLSSQLWGKRSSDATDVNKSVDDIRKDMETTNKDIEELEKQIRIEETLSKELERQLNEEIDKNDVIDKQLEDLTKQKKNLIEGIETQEKRIQSLEKTDRDLELLSDQLKKDIKKQNKDFDQQMKQLIAVKDHYKQEFQRKRIGYQSLDELLFPSNDSQELQLLRNRIKELQTEYQSLENQIEEYKQNINKKNEQKIPREVIELFADPNRVIVEMARIKVHSNQMQKQINDELKRRQTLGLNELSPQKTEKSFNSGTDSPKYIEEVVNVNVIELAGGDTQPNTSPNPSHGLFSAQSPEKDLFGAQISHNSSVGQNIGFSLFNTQSGTTSPKYESAFNLFVNQSAADSDKDSTDMFGNLFGNESKSGASSPGSAFNFFK